MRVGTRTSFTAWFFPVFHMLHSGTSSLLGDAELGWKARPSVDGSDGIGPHEELTLAEAEMECTTTVVGSNIHDPKSMAKDAEEYRPSGSVKTALNVSVSPATTFITCMKLADNTSEGVVLNPTQPGRQPSTTATSHATNTVALARATGSRQQVTGSRQHAAGSREQTACNMQHATCNMQHATCNKRQATGYTLQR